MKKIFYILYLTLSISSCTDVVQIDLNEGSPKLVVEANINWQKGQTGNEQIIKLTTTTNFYSNNVPIIDNATIKVKNIDNNQEFNFAFDKGVYKCLNFNPIINNTYQLEINWQGKIYQAVEKLMAISPISEIIQDNNSGINGRSIRVQAFFNDPASLPNFYLFNYDFIEKDGSFVKPIFYVSKDTLYNGNPFFSGTFRDTIKSGDNIIITHFGISQNYFNYLTILLRLANQNGGPFSAPPVAVRGNIININNQNDFPFGYFSLSETDFRDYTVK